MRPILSLLPFLFGIGLWGGPTLEAQDLSATEIIERTDQKMRGSSSKAQLRMTIVRPSWSREITMKSWSKGNEFALILVTQPAREKGTAYLKRHNEIWNWQPTIDRVIKLPPSMMSQSWMGSDFTNDDLIEQSSIVTDYEHRHDGLDTIDGRNCYRIELIPKEGAPVVWGRVLTWIEREEFIELKTEFYDEDDYLVNTMYGKAIKELGGRTLPSVLEVIPSDEEGHKTIVEYLELEFDIPIEDEFFSVRNMKRVR